MKTIAGRSTDGQRRPWMHSSENRASYLTCCPRPHQPSPRTTDDHTITGAPLSRPVRQQILGYYTSLPLYYLNGLGVSRGLSESRVSPDVRSAGVSRTLLSMPCDTRTEHAGVPAPARGPRSLRLPTTDLLSLPCTLIPPARSQAFPQARAV